MDNFYLRNWFCFVILSYLFKISVSLLVFYVFLPDQENISNYNVAVLSNYDRIMMVIFLAPIFETLFFQFGLIEIMYSLVKRKFIYKGIVAILLSSVAFSLTHSENAYNMIHGFFSGLVLATVYMLARKNDKKPFLSTLLIHFLFNLTVFISNEY